MTPEALESQARSYLQSQITSTAQSYIEDTLSPYGKVRLNLSIGQGGDLDGSSIDYFVPRYDNQTTVYFSQFSAQRKEDRTIGNIGLGVGIILINIYWVEIYFMIMTLPVDIAV